MATQRQKKQSHKHIPWIPAIIAVIAFLLFSTATLLWLLNIEHRIQGDWSNIFPILFTTLSAMGAIVAWLFPFSSDSTEASLLPFMSELERTSFKLGDNAAANFPFITSAILDTYNVTIQALQDASTGVGSKRGVLILGEANAGKTRLAFEALTRTLPRWSVLLWSPAYTLLDVPKLTNIRGKDLILFIDDLQEYAPSESHDGSMQVLVVDNRITILRAMLNKLRELVERVVVIATCRTEDERQTRATIGWLFQELAVVMLRRFNSDSHDPEAAQIIDAFQQHGPIHLTDWDGSLGSLVLGLSTKNSEYLKIRNDYAGTVLHAMKLLTLAGTIDHTQQRVQGACAGVFEEKALQESKKTWRLVVDQLTHLQFITERESEGGGKISLIIRKDIYFDQVITGYPSPDQPHQLTQDLAQLQDVLVALRDLGALVDLGEMLVRIERYSEGLHTIEQALLLDPTLAQAYLAKSAALVNLKRYNEGLYTIEQALRLEPTLTQAYYIKGAALVNLERYDEGLHTIEQALLLDPTLAQAYFIKGYALVGTKRYDEGLDAIEQALLLDPNPPNLAQVFSKKGLALLNLMRYDEVVAATEQALLLDPNRASDYFIKGTALVILKRYDEGLDAIERALLLDPNLPNLAQVYLSKGDVLMMLKRYAEALTATEQALRLDPDLAQAYFTLGAVLLNLERYDEALTAIEHILALHPKDVYAWSVKAKILWALGKESEARAAEVKAKNLDN
jgi:tetratricopeptide (TPR) repeat protein